MADTILDPYQIATMGVTGEPITIATNGWIVFIEEEIVDDDQQVSPGGGVYEDTIWDPWKEAEKEKKKKKKRITATVIIDGIKYSDTVEVEDLTITAKDVNVEVSDKPKPSIKITVIRGDK